MRVSRELVVVDAHAGGEPGRVIVDGVGDVPGATIYDKMIHLSQHGDALRRLMLTEPRGYPATCCNLLLPPTDPNADAAFVVMEQSEYPPMSGSNTICVVTVLLETGRLPAREPVTDLVLETPAGLVEVSARVEGGKVGAVTFRNVPAFTAYLDAPLEVPELGEISVDVAWGGMFFVIADADVLGLSLEAGNAAEVARTGEMIRAAAAEQLPVEHPEDDRIRGVSISQLSSRHAAEGADRRNAVVVSTGAFDWRRPATWRGVLDRSPCGTGTCARMATLWARGELEIGRPFRHQGPLGTIFTGRLLEETRLGSQPAVVPELTGSAWITGYTRFVVDPSDPFPEGFRLGDLWG